MERYFAIVCLLAISIVVTGCGGGTNSEQASGGANGESDAPSMADESGPEYALYEFLEAVRTGSDEAAASMFTPLARQKLEEMQMEVAPQGSDTASFKIETDSIEYLADRQGARVKSSWTDLGVDGEPESQEITWMLRRETEGWRIAGMGTRVFDDAPPLYLNFEDVEDMLYKQQELQREIARRIEAHEQQAAQPQNPAGTKVQ